MMVMFIEADSKLVRSFPIEHWLIIGRTSQASREAVHLSFRLSPVLGLAGARGSQEGSPLYKNLDKPSIWEPCLSGTISLRHPPGPAR